MIDKEKSLIKRKDSIFSRIINFVKKIFFKTKKENITENINKENQDIQNDKKEVFFELYNAIKNKEKNISDLSISELIAVTQIMNNEIDLKLKKIENEIKKGKEIDEKIANLKVS